MYVYALDAWYRIRLVLGNIDVHVYWGVGTIVTLLQTYISLHGSHENFFFTAIYTGVWTWILTTVRPCFKVLRM